MSREPSSRNFWRCPFSVTPRRRGFLACILFLLTSNPYLEAESTPPQSSSADLALSLPVSPLALMATESCIPVAESLHDLHRLNKEWQRGTDDLARLAEQLPQAALGNLFLSLAHTHPDDPRAAAALLVLLPSPNPFNPVPKLLLVVRPDRSIIDGRKLCLQFAGEIPLEFPGDPEKNKGTDTARISLFSVSHKGLLFFCEDLDTLVFTADRWGRALQPEAIRAPLMRARKSTPGPFWFYVNLNRVLPLLSFLLPQDQRQLLHQLLSPVETLSLSLSQNDPRRRLQLMLLPKESKDTDAPSPAFTPLLCESQLNLSTHATTQGELILKGELTLHSLLQEKRWSDWVHSTFPAEIQGFHLFSQDLAMLTGIHPARDLPSAFHGSLRLLSLRASPLLPPSTRVEFGLTPGNDLASFMDRSSRWSGWFAQQGLSSRELQPLPDGGWQITGASETAFKRIMLTSDSLQLMSAVDPDSFASSRESGNVQSALTCTTSAKGAELDLSWIQLDDLYPAMDLLFSSLNAGGELLAEEEASPLPVLALRILMSAEINYRLLQLGRHNGRPATAFLQDLTALNRDLDGEKQRITLVPELLLSASLSPDRLEESELRTVLSSAPSLGGYCFLPARSVEALPLNWQEECILLALPVSPGPLQGYAVNQSGVVYRAPVSRLLSRDLPADWEAAGFIPVTHKWKTSESSPKEH